MRRLRSLRPGDWVIAAGVAVIALLATRLIGEMLLGPAPDRTASLVWALSFPFVVLVIGVPVLVGLLALRAWLQD